MRSARRNGSAHSWFAEGERPETSVEAVCENDGLENVLFSGEILVLACR